MFFHLDFTSPLPIYEQIVRGIKFAVAAGGIAPNELIPSVRDLARDLAINPNTVARAYRTLQDDAVVFAKRGTGLAVAPNAPQKCRIQRLEIFQTRFRQFLDDARRSGLSELEIDEIVKQE
ncbi:MAG: GntR family transcriptional regulator [Thermoguttaceae bacterium]